jgi:fatty acid desaturase
MGKTIYSEWATEYLQRRYKEESEEDALVEMRAESESRGALYKTGIEQTKRFTALAFRWSVAILILIFAAAMWGGIIQRHIRGGPPAMIYYGLVFWLCFRIIRGGKSR